MNKYNVQLSNDNETFTREILANSPEQAIEKAGTPYPGFYATVTQVTKAA